jgi:hypothetical protein
MPVPGALASGEPGDPDNCLRAGLVLARGGLGGDQLKPAHRAGLAARQRRQAQRSFWSG